MSDKLYKILGLSRGASDDEIRKAYRREVKTCHPDRHPGDKAAEEKFKKISSAYAILGDKEKRARYDRGEIDDDGTERAPGWQQGGFAGAGPFAGGGARHQYHAGGAGFAGVDDIISELFGGASRGGFTGAAGGFGTGRGGDVRYELTVDFLDAARGGRKPLRLPDGRALDVNIPAGIKDGQTLRLKGQGQPGRNGTRGDALIEIKVKDHPRFRREDLDIHIDQPLPLATAVTGGKLRVPTIHGEVAIKVAPWTSSGKVMRLKGRGIAEAKSGRRGDQLVRLMIELPKHDEELEALFKKREESVGA